MTPTYLSQLISIFITIFIHQIIIEHISWSKNGIYNVSVILLWHQHIPHNLCVYYSEEEKKILYKFMYIDIYITIWRVFCFLFGVAAPESPPSI